jgi:hypothetical protein
MVFQIGKYCLPSCGIVGPIEALLLMVELLGSPLSHLASSKGPVHCIAKLVGCFVLLA